METAGSSRNSKDENSSVALAFAVAALQRGESPENVILPSTLDASSISNSEDAPKKESLVTGSNTSSEESVTKEQHNSGTIERLLTAAAAATAAESAPADRTHVSDNDNSSTPSTTCPPRPPQQNEARLAKSRERNREHARRTRLRKKAQMESLQAKVQSLEAERQSLKQKVEECRVASILLGISGSNTCTSCSSSSNSGEPKEEDSDSSTAGAAATNSNNSDLTESPLSENSSAGVAASTLITNENALARLTAACGNSGRTSARRKRFLAEAASACHDNNNSSSCLSDTQTHQHCLQICINGEQLQLGSNCHVNWKTGTYRDETTGMQRHLTEEQLQTLRRERNRMHAKLTRDRKKSYIQTMEKLIEELQADVNRLKNILTQASSLSPSSATADAAVAATTESAGNIGLDDVSHPNMVSPELLPAKEPLTVVLEDTRDDVTVSEEVKEKHFFPPPKRVRRSFSLDD